ncbi:putative lipoprotein YiaD precursor [compost metagenome]
MTDYLAKQGVAAGRMSTEGRGPNDPIGDNATAEGRALNRRVEIYLYAVKQ